MNANLNMDNQKITNLGDATDNDDAVNFSQLKSHTDSHLNNYHLQPSFTFYRNFGNQGKVPRSTRINPFPNHHHHGLNWVKKEGSDSGFNAQAWVSLKMTNNLAAGVYTVVFETFSAISAGNITQLNNETLITQVYGHGGYTIITFSYDYQTTHSKDFSQFKSDGQPGRIDFQMRYYGSSYNNPSLNFLFYSRVVAGKQGTAFNHALFDVDDVQYKNQIIYFEDVNLNDNKLKGLAAPSEDKDGANKKYVDDQIKAIPAVDTSDLLKLDGSRAMTGTLNLGGQRVENIKAFIEDDSSQSASDAQKYDVVNWGKIHEIRGDLKREINQVAYDALNRKSPDPMLDPIDMNNNKIKGLAEPTDLKDGANKKYVDDQIKAIPAVDTSDLLNLDGSRAMTGNLQMGDNFITNVKDPLPSNSHYAATVNFVNTTVSDNNTTISTLIDSKFNQVEDLNMKAAKQENVFSFIMDDDLFKEDATTKTFDNHSRTIINFNKPGNLNIIDLDIDITMKNKARIAYDPTTTIFVVIYGVSGHQNHVESRIWDRVYLIQNNTVLFEATIDMKNKQIKNLADGAEDGDAVNVSQLINMITTENTEIDKIKTDVTNNYDLLLALYNYIMKNGTKVGILKDLYFTDSQESRTTNTYLFNFSTHLDNNIKTNFTFYHVFSHNIFGIGLNDVMTIAFLWNRRVGLNPFHCYIHVSKIQIKIALNPLINDPHLSLINFPNNALGKKNWFWIWMQGNSFHLITSGTNVNCFTF